MIRNTSAMLHNRQALADPGSQGILFSDLRSTDDDRPLRSPFVQACQDGDLPLVQSLWASGEVSEIDRQRGCRKACAYAWPEIVQWLWSRGPWPEWMRYWCMARASHRHRPEVHPDIRLVLVQWIWTQNPINAVDDRRLSMTFAQVCCHGRLEMARWMYGIGWVRPVGLIQQCFRVACRHGHLATSRWLWSLSEVDHHLQEDDLWYKSCGERRLEMMQWLWSLGGYDRGQLLPVWMDACDEGWREGARWMWSLGVLGRADVQRVFPIACGSGRLEMARWLRSLGEMDRHADNDAAWREACTGGQMTVAQWLYALGAVDIHARGDEAWCRACEGGWMTVAQWIYSLGGVDVHAREDEAWRAACSRLPWLQWTEGEVSPLEMAQWIYSLGGVDIHACEDEAWRQAMFAKNLELAKWIYSLGGVDHHAHQDEAWRQAIQSLDNGPMIYLLELGISEQLVEAVPAHNEDVWATIKAWQRDRRLKSARSRDLSVEEDQ